jgi:exodeoxyribonuclease X
VKIIRVIDLETTGEAPPAARVVEIGWCDVCSIDDGPWVVHPPAQSQLINPGITIPPEVSAIHHIVDADVAAAASFEEWWPAIGGPEIRENVIALAAHMAKFERQFITDAMTGARPWVCTYKCALRLWQDAPSHGNQALRYWRKPEGLDRELALVAHRAGPDAYVTAFHLRDMLNGGAKLEHMIARSNVPALQVRCHIGEHRGKLWREVDSGFLRWLLLKDFDEDVKFTASYWLHQRSKEVQEMK